MCKLRQIESNNVKRTDKNVLQAQIEQSPILGTANFSALYWPKYFFSWKSGFVNLASFWPILAQIIVFSKKKLRHCYTHRRLTCCKRWEKSYDAKYENFTDGQTEGRNRLQRTRVWVQKWSPGNLLWNDIWLNPFENVNFRPTHKPGQEW